MFMAAKTLAQLSKETVYMNINHKAARKIVSLQGQCTGQLVLRSTHGS